MTKKFEDLKIWQHGMNLCDDYFMLSKNSFLSSDFALKEQMNRSVISVPSNIAEGFERNSPKSFVYFLKVAKGSLAEFRTQLQICRRRSYIKEQEFEQVYEKCLSLGRMIQSLINSIEQKGTSPDIVLEESPAYDQRMLWNEEIIEIGKEYFELNN